jgi:hypothetical protein
MSNCSDNRAQPSNFVTANLDTANLESSRGYKIESSLHLSFPNFLVLAQSSHLGVGSWLPEDGLIITLVENGNKNN